MTNEELYEAMKQGFAQINSRLDEINTRLESLEESNEEVRSATNSLLSWAEDVAVVVKVPMK